MKATSECNFWTYSALSQALACFGILGLTVACNDTSRRHLYPSDPAVPELIIHASDLETYSLGDAHCAPIASESEAPELLKTVELDRWQEGVLGRVLVETSALGIKTRPLSSAAVSGVLMDAVFRRTCDADIASPPNCATEANKPAGWLPISLGTPINACLVAMTPARNSLEHLALSALTSIESASMAIRRLLPANTIIPPLSVIVTPRFESRWIHWIENGNNSTYEQVLGDNLSYFPQTASTPPYIALLPKQKASRDKVTLWESPFIISHEFSHHIERSLHLDHFDEPRSQMRIAVSEGFADVTAFASLGLSSQSLKGIPCIGADRSPDQSAFNAGIPKIVTSALLDRMTSASASTASEKGLATCQGTLPHSAHGLGAIFAHWIMNFASYTPANEINPAQAVVTLSIEWLKQVNLQMPTGQTSPEKDLEKIARAFEVAVTLQFSDTTHPLTENVRALLREKIVFAFPTLKNLDWFL